MLFIHYYMLFKHYYMLLNFSKMYNKHIYVLLSILIVSVISWFNGDGRIRTTDSVIPVARDLFFHELEDKKLQVAEFYSLQISTEYFLLSWKMPHETENKRKNKPWNMSVLHGSENYRYYFLIDMLNHKIMKNNQLECR